MEPQNSIAIPFPARVLRRIAPGTGLRLQALGDWLQRRQDLIRRVQWAVVALYAFLLIVPVFLPEPAAEAGVFGSLARFAEALFWGLWWPGVILSMMVFGQFWCGLLCPDGTVTEFVSRHGRGLKVPAWLRWPALPLVLFGFITLYEHLIDAYRFAHTTLLVVGGTSALALLTGLIYGRGKRVWCRYVCPGASMFSLLARCAVLHFKVDRATWDAAPRPSPAAVDCPPLLDVRRLKSNEKCNMCGRCSGHRKAVALSWRGPGEEISTLQPDEVRGWEAAGILFVLIGLLYGAIHWPHSPWHAQVLGALRVALGDAAFWQAATPWWLFAQAASGVQADFANALAALLSMLGAALLIGGGAGALLLVASAGQRSLATALAYALIPLGGIGLALWALEHSFGILAANGLDAWWFMPWLRFISLTLGLVWSVWLARGLLRQWRAHLSVPARALPLFALCSLLLAGLYQFAPLAH